MGNKINTFTIEQGGQLFHCTSEIKGSRLLNQIVHVEGFGSRPDSTDYGKTGHSASAMRLAAKVIALDIIKNSAVG